MRRAVQAVPLLMILLLLLCYGMSLGSGLVDNVSSTLYLPDGGNSYSSLLTAEQRTASPLPFAMWRQQERRAVTATGLGRTGNVSVMTVYGDSGIVLPSLGLLVAGDQSGCLLDSGSCYRLFGNPSPIGETVTVAEVDYVITGVFDHPSPMLVLQGADGGGSECDRVTLALGGTPNPTQAAEDFSMRHGLDLYTSISSGIWSGLTSTLVQLVPLALLCILLWQSLRLVITCRATPVLAGIVIGGTAVAAVAFWVLCGLSVTIPATLIPSRWSDFEFWNDTFATIKQQLWLLLTIPKELPQAIAIWAVLRCAAWSVAALALLVGVVRVQVSDGKWLFWLVVWCITAAFIAAVTVQSATAALWLMLPLFFGWQAAIEQVRQLVHDKINPACKA